MGSSVKNHTLAALLLSLVLLALFAWWFQGGLIPLAAYAVVALLATLSVPLVYRISGYTLRDELEWLENREAIEHREMIQRLQQIRQQLSDLGIEEGVRQADMLEGILDDYHSVVETRFVGKKHSPLAYLSAARTVQKHAVQNLNDVVAVGHSISTIKRNKFEQVDTDRASQQQEKYAEQKQRMESLLEENRKLFDALTDTAVEVANIKSFNRYERIDTLARLVTLAEVASNSGK